MRSVFSMILSSALLSASFTSLAADTASSASSTTSASNKSDKKVVALIEAAEKQHPFFTILSKDKPDFRKSWENRIALGQIFAPKNTQKNLAVVTGITMALEEADGYLSKADDNAANQYVAALSSLMAIGASDKEVCEVMLPGSTSKDSSAALEARMAPDFINTLLPALSAVISSGSKGEIKILSKKELETLVVPVVLSMAKEHGPESVQRLANLEDPSIESTQRCESMSWMMKSIIEQPEAERAMLARTLFSKQSRAAAGIEE